MKRVEPMEPPLKYKLDVHPDEQGLFVELLGQSIPGYSGPPFAQWNCSVSKPGVFRGLHFQAAPHAQTKLITVLSGRITDICLDLRRGSTLGVTHEFYLEPFDQLLVPPHFAHGFYTHEAVVVVYGCTPGRVVEAERVVRHAGHWRPRPVRSPRDAAAPSLVEFATQHPGELPP